jgi:hypothetical protein
MLVVFLLILTCTAIIEASHFNGGTIMWAPVYPSSNSSSVLITITQSYSWSYSKVNCTTNVPITTSSYSNNNVNLTCVGNCTNQGGYPSTPVNILTDCVSSSSSLGMITSQRSVNITLTVGAYFWISYAHSGWITLENAPSGNNDWSIVSLIDLQRRSDGIIDTPPTSQITSPQYIIVNKTSIINIPVSDINAGDDVRCRWSVKNRYCKRKRIYKLMILYHNQTRRNCYIDEFEKRISG